MFGVMISIFYTIGFLVTCCVLAGLGPTAAPRDKPWVPARARGDACLMPLFFVLPAFFWPQVFPAMILGFLYLTLSSLGRGLWSLAGTATSATRRQSDKAAEPTAAASSSPDLEMGPVVACGEDGEGDEPDGGVDDSDSAGVRCSGSGESDRPPSYASLPPDEDGDGEADGLLAKSAE
ncbi:hypothetical protein diail_1738 [Diaporthe ilicicola]|nr:hypothetical protein diail_1738 [Diaporthe ilicicola]